MKTLFYHSSGVETKTMNRSVQNVIVQLCGAADVARCLAALEVELPSHRGPRD